VTYVKSESAWKARAVILMDLSLKLVAFLILDSLISGLIFLALRLLFEFMKVVIAPNIAQLAWC
jgi:hypothetical protein